MTAVAQMLIVFGLGLFAISFVAFRLPSNIASLSDEDEEEDDGRKMIDGVLGAMRAVSRVLAGLLVVAGVVLLFLN